MKHIIIGTGGHIDHGKSTLVQALTGIDPDRLAEEKKRQITIDLGFAWFNWENRLDVFFIDVPGHEKFVHNMLAGIGAVDILLLVVAADEGVMPQTREHLHICDLLGIAQGIVAITRQDLADPEMDDLVRQEINALTKGTFMEESPVLSLSAVTGEGLDDLRKEIDQIAEKSNKKSLDSFFRMPIDRSFTYKGFGTIVTGTVLSGQANSETNLMLYPCQKPLKTRGFQIHNQAVEVATQGQRLAVNIVGIHKDAINRGDQLSLPGKLINSRLIDVEVKIIPEKKGLLKNRSQVKFYSNAQESLGQLVSLGDFDGESADLQWVQIRLKEEISCCFGDRFILRVISPLETVAGGRILAPLGNRSRKNKIRVLESLAGLASDNAEIRVLESIFLAGTRAIEAQTIPSRVGISNKSIQKILSKLASQGKIIQTHPEKKQYLHEIHVRRIGAFFVKTLDKLHKKNPEKPTIHPTEFFGKMSRLFEPQQIVTLLNWAAKNKILVKEDAGFRLQNFQGGLNIKQKETLHKILQYLKQSGVHPPGLVNMAKELSLDLEVLKKILKLSLLDKTVIKVKDDLWYHPDIIIEIKQKLVVYFSENTSITVIGFKEMFFVSRKHAIGLLEYFDGLHFTRRIENKRILLDSLSN